jgi:restriction modification system, type I
MRVRIGELTSIRTGKLDANASSLDGEYPFFTCSREPLRISTYSYDCECVLVAGNGDMNVKYYNGKFDAYQRTYIIENNSSGKLYMPYLYFFMLSYIEELRKQAIGGVIKYIKLGNLTEAQIELPTIEEQKKIVQILESADSIIKREERQQDCFNDLIKARFVEMFGDPVKNTKGWQVKRLEELSIQINSGNTPKGGSSIYVDEGIAFFRSQNVWKDRLEMEDIVYISNDIHVSMKRSSLKNGDILMTKTGRINTENSSLGRAALYMGEDDKANVNGHVYFIRLKPEVNNKFILRILVSVEYRDLIRSVCVGGIDKRQLNKEHIENFPIICPPDNLVDKYIELVDHIDKSKVEVKRALDEAQLLFDSLMQKYFG